MRRHHLLMAAGAALLVASTFLNHLHPAERTIDRYITYFIGLLDGSDESVELFVEQRRASPEMKRLLSKRQREMQERRRASRNAQGSPYAPSPGLSTGDAQWGLDQDRGDLEELRELVGDRLLKCLARDASLPRDVRENVSRFVGTEPELRRLGDLEDLRIDDPRACRRPVPRTCLAKFETDLMGFLKQVADPDGEQYLMRFGRLMRTASRKPRWETQGWNSDPNGGTDDHDGYGGDGEEEDDDGERYRQRGLSWWIILLIIVLLLLLLVGIGYALYWFFRRKRLERRAILAAAAAGISAAASEAVSGD